MNVLVSRERDKIDNKKYLVNKFSLFYPNDTRETEENSILNGASFRTGIFKGAINDGGRSSLDELSHKISLDNNLSSNYGVNLYEDAIYVIGEKSQEKIQNLVNLLLSNDSVLNESYIGSSETNLQDEWKLLKIEIAKEKKVSFKLVG